jgi:DNA polymerase III delta prime subunit
MRIILGLQDLLNKAKSKRLQAHVNLDNAQNQGTNSIIQSVNSGGISLGNGPPGTGKTLTFNMAQYNVFEYLDSNEAVIYVAPTNRLVEESAVRMLALLLSKGYSEKDLLSFVRVYGSHYKPLALNKDVKIIFTTPYQPGALRFLLRFKKRLHLMIDEASTTPLHGPFIELAMAMAELTRNNETVRLDMIYSFNVIGDPMQAITGRFTFQEKFDLLIIGRLLQTVLPEDEKEHALKNPPEIFELAEKYHSNLGVKYFFLKYTYRMPHPTELLVSIPYYKRLLEGAISYKERLKGIKNEEPSLISRVLQSCQLLNTKQNLVQALNNSLDSEIPVVYFKDKGSAYLPRQSRRPQEIEELDMLRAQLASEVARYLASITAENINIEVLVPYIEMKTHIQMNLRSLPETYEKFGQRINISTVHSALGSEVDIIIAVLGKEYKGKGKDAMTIYFQTPELLNVQFSRHKRMLVLIGNLEKLAKAFKNEPYNSHVFALSQALKELENKGAVLKETFE